MNSTDSPDPFQHTDWYTLQRQDEWETIGRGRSFEMIDELNRQLAPIYIPPPFFRLANRIDLPFYPQYDLIRLDDLNVDQPGVIYLLHHEANDQMGTDVYILNMSNEPIYKLNKKDSLQLNVNNIEDYLHFFFCFVEGRHGRFFFIQTEKDINALEGSTSFKNEIRDRYKPPSTKEYLDRKYKTHTQVVFKDALFEADITVNKTGVTEIIHEELLFQHKNIDHGNTE